MTSKQKKLFHPSIGHIPYQVRISRISKGAKLLFGDLSGLSQKHGYAFATNEQLAELNSCSLRAIERYMSELRKEGLIECTYQNISYRDRNDKLLWKKKRKVYTYKAFIPKTDPREPDEISELDKPVENDSNKDCDTAKDCGIIDTATDGGYKIKLIKENKIVSQSMSDNSSEIENIREALGDIKVTDRCIRNLKRLHCDEDILNAITRMKKENAANPGHIENFSGYLTNTLKNDDAAHERYIRLNKQLCREKNLHKCNDLTFTNTNVSAPTLNVTIQFNEEPNEFIRKIKDIMNLLYP